MSMIGNFRSLPEADIEALFERPGRVVKLLYNEEPAAADGGGGLLSLFRRGSGTPSEPDTWEPSGEGEEIDVDKAWHGIHYLLTGTDWTGDEPHNFIVQGGREIGNVDVGYGPARALAGSEVQEIAAALDLLPPEELTRRFDPEEMTRLKIYPEIWSRDPAEDNSQGYLVEYYTELRDFISRTAERGHGLLIYLN
jgi:hypothetical protein